MKLRNTTKMAFQAAIAIAIAELISLSFNLERSYWITLTAMALTTQTWGESVKRSFERVGMTIMGGAVGTLLYFLLPNDNPMLFIVFLFVFVFFTVYMVKIYHLISVFFLTCLVVFLFALIGKWTWHLLQTRILDTALGAVIAISVGSFFFSIRTNVNDLFIDYLQKMNALLATVFTTHKVRREVTSQDLAADFHKIRKAAIAIRYELLFHRLSSKEFNNLLNKYGLCTRYVINLRQAYNWLSPHLCQEDNNVISLTAAITRDNIDRLVLCLQKKNHENMIPAANVRELITKEIATNPGRFATLESDALGFFSLMYFFTRLNTCLNEIYALVSKA